jgi:glycine dehydrogenase subunit 2
MENQQGTTHLAIEEPLLFETGSEGRTAVPFPAPVTGERGLRESLPPSSIRGPIEGFPELSQPEVVRHFTRISQWNYGVDTGFYPLGSCTMKYNPKVNEAAAGLSGFAYSHPHQPERLSQGSLALMHRLEGYLSEVTGMDRVTLQPAAGAQGELTAMMMIRAYFTDRKKRRSRVIVPDTAHGTNPASVSMCGFTALPVASGPHGLLETKAVAELMDEDVAAIMITNPNTLGIFESNMADIAEIVHDKGGLVYCDGANLNALMGVVRFGDMGCDLAHMNLHKTFSTPHGGGGPGAGPLAVKKPLVPYLPVPTVEMEGEGYRLDYGHPKSIGKVRSFFGNFLILVRAYSYILALGGNGLERASVAAVVNANYLRAKLTDHYNLPYETPCLHECVFNDRLQQKHGVSTLDIAKRLMDYGFHPPTIYFPLVVDGALMIEPTESESRQSLDRFIAAMASIAREAETEPALLHEAPVKTRTTRVDEVAAARKPVLRWTSPIDPTSATR